MKYGLLPARFAATCFTLAICLTSSFAEPSGDKKEKEKPSGKKPLVKVRHTSAYKNAHIIVNRGEHTIVPIRSILVLPEKLKSHVVDKPSGKLILWPQFKRKNQNLIWTLEVTLDQVKGITPISESKLDDLTKLNRVVVALYRGHPVSVVRPKKKDDSKEPTTEKK